MKVLLVKVFIDIADKSRCPKEFSIVESIVIHGSSARFSYECREHHIYCFTKEPPARRLSDSSPPQPRILFSTPRGGHVAQ